MESAAPYVSNVLAVLVTSTDSNAATCQIGSKGLRAKSLGKTEKKTSANLK